MSNTAYIGLGSNMGNRLSYLKEALEKLNENNACRISKLSSIYETKPYGVKDQDNFINAAAEIKTSYDLIHLFKFLKNLEQEIGRHKTYKWGPREIDLDLLFFNNLIYEDEKLTLPHKGIEFRDFVLVPLSEIAPNYIHPALNVKISDICIDKLEKNIIRKIPEKIF